MTYAGSDVLAGPADPTEFPEVVTLKEASALLGWSPQATLKAARDGELPVATFGSSQSAHWRLLRDRVCGVRNG